MSNLLLTAPGERAAGLTTGRHDTTRRNGNDGATTSTDSSVPGWPLGQIRTGARVVEAQGASGPWSVRLVGDDGPTLDAGPGTASRELSL